ncbi:hypothetical protein AGMMS4952_15390 [Spirochaetia bacterium]|nr:hypothetical protein AGMMS4952_15390 [Spirochaetia bacterium]
MKGTNNFLFFALALIAAIALGACDNPVIPPDYTVEFPGLPASWQELMGPAHWHLTWFNPQGIPQSRECSGKTSIEAVLEWATPVLAFPYWPGLGILPGEMHPAGGIIPFDTAGGTLRLSWRGGAEAWFYRELSAARNTAVTGNTNTANKRRPEYFDWPRFRELMNSDSIPEAVRDDPWLADWHDIAIRTVTSGFNRQRIKVQAGEELLVTRDALDDAAAKTAAPEGSRPVISFTGPSPFAKPLAPEPEGGFRFWATARPDTYVSAGGKLRINRKTWMYTALGMKL